MAEPPRGRKQSSRVTCRRVSAPRTVMYERCRGRARTACQGPPRAVRTPLAFSAAASCTSVVHPAVVTGGAQAREPAVLADLLDHRDHQRLFRETALDWRQLACLHLLGKRRSLMILCALRGGG